MALRRAKKRHHPSLSFLTAAAASGTVCANTHKGLSMTARAYEFQAEILKAIAQETRLSIIELLRDGERCVCEIFPAINQEQSNVSRHLNVMQKAGILTRRKEGLRIFYAVKHPEVLAIIELAAALMKNEAGSRNDLLRTG
jgi:ArsR family transcriptional regulator